MPLRPETAVLVMLLVAQGVLAATLSAILLVFGRSYRERFVRLWAASWVALAVSLLLSASNIAGYVPFGPTHPIRILATVVAQVAGFLQLGWLVLGAFDARWGPKLRFRTVALVTAGSALIGVVAALAFAFDPDGRGLRIAMRVGGRAVISGLVLAPVAVLLWRGRGAEPGISRRLLAVALLAFVATQIHYLGYVYEMVSGIPAGNAVAYFGLVDLAVQALLGGSMIGWLIEKDRHREVARVEEEAHLERELRQGDARFRAVVAMASDEVFVIDAAGRFRPDAVIASQWGLRSEELVGRSAFDAVHPEDSHWARDVLRRVVHETARRASAELRIRSAEGWRVVDCMVENRLDDPDLRGIVVSARDVTDRKRLEVRLLQAQRMDGIGRLAGGVAHDFNNLLTVIASNAELALEGIPAGAVAREEVDEIRQAAERGGQLTRQLLAFARRDVVAPVVVDINELVVGMDKMLRRLIGEDVELRAWPAREPAWVRADTGQLEQVVLNLVVNARDAMPDGGAIDVSVGFAAVAETPEPACELPPGRYVTVTVRDSGVGMDDAVKEHLFEPFFTTKPVGEGTGLGLATCYGIVRQSGGSIAVDSGPGQGATFVIHLPRSEAPLRPLERRPDVGTGEGRETLLLVEDEEAVRRAATRTLEARGYRVLVARDGHEALERLGTGRAGVELVVTDVVMPRLGGLALAHELRRRWPELPVLLTSGYADEFRDEAAVPAERTEFLRKPYTPGELVDRVRRLLDGALPDRPALQG